MGRVEDRPGLTTAYRPGAPRRRQGAFAGAAARRPPHFRALCQPRRRVVNSHPTPGGRPRSRQPGRFSDHGTSIERPATMKAIPAIGILLTLTTGLARAADAPQTVDLWPGQVPGETGQVGEEKVQESKPNEKPVKR